MPRHLRVKKHSTPRLSSPRNALVFAITLSLVSLASALSLKNQTMQNPGATALEPPTQSAPLRHEDRDKTNQPSDADIRTVMPTRETQNAAESGSRLPSELNEEIPGRTSGDVASQATGTSAAMESAASKLETLPTATLFNFNKATEDAQLLSQTAVTDSIEATNYSALLTDLFQSLGYAASRPGSRNTTPDRALPNATLHENYCEPLLTETGLSIRSAKVSSGFVPKGLVLNPISGTLCGTPNETGIFRFQVTFQTDEIRDLEKSFRLVVKDAEDSQTEGELQLSTKQLPVGQVGAEYNYQLQARGGHPPYHWSVAGLPSDLEFDEATGIIAGSPTEAGEFPLLVTVTDDLGKSGSQSFSLLVRETPVFITTSVVEDGILGQNYQARFSAQGGVPPYTWSNINSSLPEGLTLNASTGTLEGTPTQLFEDLLRIRVTDSKASTDTADIPVHLRASSLHIITQNLTEAFAGESYQFTLSAEGGLAPYTWTQKGSALPNSMSLSPQGVLSGLPEAIGEFGFSVELIDKLGQAVTQNFILRITQKTSVVQETPTPDLTTPTPEDPPTLAGPDIGGVTPTFPTVEEFQAFPSNGKVGLSWKNPSRRDFTSVTIVRTENSPAVRAEEGTTIYSGASNTALDLNASNDVTYFYTAFVNYLSDTGELLPVAPSTTATPHDLSLLEKPDPFADEVANFQPLDANCFHCSLASNIVLGAPKGGGEYQGSADIVSLGARVNDNLGSTPPYGGSITLSFKDNIVVNGPGVDFTIFENAFRISGTDLYFVEPAIVEVSADGEKFYRFPVDFVPHYNEDGTLNLFNPFSYPVGFSGIKPVYTNSENQASPAATNTFRSGGDQFDLSDLPGAPLTWIRFIRITSTGDNWLTDKDGDFIRHSNSAPFFAASGKGNSGFDLDAVTAVNY